VRIFRVSEIEIAEVSISIPSPVILIGLVVVYPQHFQEIAGEGHSGLSESRDYSLEVTDQS
jgi:hypothetical protein